jgi:hypothetical protein
LAPTFYSIGHGALLGVEFVSYLPRFRIDLLLDVRHIVAGQLLLAEEAIE